MAAPQIQYVRESQRNQPGGFAGLDGSGDLTFPVIHKSMTYAQLMDGYVPKVGELVICSDTNDIHMGDGATVGGLFLMAPEKSHALSNLDTEFGAGGAIIVTLSGLTAGRIYEVNIKLTGQFEEGATGHPVIQVQGGQVGTSVVTGRVPPVLPGYAAIQAMGDPTYPEADGIPPQLYTFGWFAGVTMLLPPGPSVLALKEYFIFCASLSYVPGGGGSPNVVVQGSAAYWTKLLSSAGNDFPGCVVTTRRIA